MLPCQADGWRWQLAAGLLTLAVLLCSPYTGCLLASRYVCAPFVCPGWLLWAWRGAGKDGHV